MSPATPAVTPVVTVLRMTGAAGREELPLLVLGPSLGTSAATLWTACAAGLTAHFDVLAWDLPGHGHNRSVPAEPFTMADLARGVLAVVDDVLAQRDQVGGHFCYAGDSVGGAVGLQLLLDAPERVRSAALLCTGAQIGSAEMWSGRMGQVGISGTAVMVPGSAERWFAPGFLEREPEVGSALLHALSDTVDDGYVAVCGALAGFDVRDRLGEVDAPVLAIAGAQDAVTPEAKLAEIADGVIDGDLVVLENVAHLAPAEAPGAVASLLREHFLGIAPADPVGPVDVLGVVAGAGAGAGDRDRRTVAEVRAAGLAVRREVLGAAHVDRATAAATDLTADFQDFITEYAWGGVWTRPGLDRRSRSMVTLTALVALGHHDELALHVRAALTNGLSTDEIKEVLLQSAIYCGVPAANTAFRIAQRVLDGG